MASDRGRPLPKFGEWDVNDPASADGYTVIFNKARDDRKRTGSDGKSSTPGRKDSGRKNSQSHQYPPKKKWLCCVCIPDNSF